MKEYKLYKDKVLIKFDDEVGNHRFYNAEGDRIISVTAITGIIDKSAALMGWAIRLMGEYLLQQKAKGNNKITDELIDTAKRKYREAQKEARDRGKETHEWISKWIKGEKPDMPEDMQIVNGISAFLKFQKENQFKWTDSEIVCYSQKHQYAGFIDAIANKKKQKILVDFKSSNGIYPEMIMQVIGYVIAWEEEHKKKIDRAMIIKFGKETGDFEMREIEITKENKEAFIGLLAVARFLNKNK